VAATIALCLIARDEAEMLPAFLASVRGAWDELVAVDTGSRDETPDLLAAAGGRVLHRAWTGDFAAARNRGLEAATADWILVLDPDERASPALVAALRGAGADPRCGAATLRVSNPLPNGGTRDARLLRMFRRDPSVRFRHAIHEDAGEAVAAHLARTGRALVDLAPPLLHLGYVRDRAAAKRKKDRDVGILHATLAREPDDLYAWLKLAEQARFWGDGALLAQAARGGGAALARAAPGALDAAWAGELVALLATPLHPDPRAALSWLEVFDGRVPESAALRLRVGELRELCGDARGARREFERCLALASETEHAQLAGVRPRLGLARLALEAGDVETAARETALGLADAPLDREALLLGAVLAQATGGRPGLAAWAEARRAVSGGAAEIEAALAEAERLG
jgi:hypothetical protein